MGCKSFNASGILSVIEKVMDGKSRKGIEVFFENGDGFKTRVISLLVGSNNRNEINNVLETLQERVNSGIASVKTKHSLSTNNIINNHRYSTPLHLNIQ